MYALLLANAMQNYCKCLGVANILTIFIQVSKFVVFMREMNGRVFRFLQIIVHYL